jgi:hypothetical protein
MTACQIARERSAGMMGVEALVASASLIKTVSWDIACSSVGTSRPAVMVTTRYGAIAPITRR